MFNSFYSCRQCVLVDWRKLWFFIRIHYINFLVTGTLGRAKNLLVLKTQDTYSGAHSACQKENGHKFDIHMQLLRQG